MYRNVTACFTGHRPEKLPWGSDERDPRCLRLKERISDVVEALYESGIRRFICGMARGGDTYFCEAVLRLRDEHPEVALEAAIPFDGQAAGWDAADRRRFYYLVAECSSVKVISHEYSRDCYRLRNEYMVENSSVVVAVLSGDHSGTAQTVRYARDLGREVIIIDPNT